LESGAELAVTWMGHSSAVLEIGGRRILTDPVWSERASPVSFAGPRRWVPPPLPLDRLPAPDLVLLSHNHYDHMDRPTVRWLARRWPSLPWVAPLGVGRALRRWGVRRVTELDWWDETEIDGIRVAATPAQHFSGRTFWDRNATLWCGFAVAVGEYRAYYAGDTAYHPDFRAIAERYGPFDLSLLPIGAYAPRWFMRSVHMDAEEAVQAFGELDAAHPDSHRRRVMVPVHWGTFKLTDEPMDEPPRRARETWDRLGLPAEDLWLLDHGETRTLSDGR
jgi:N-acyl-phosphatidylethanolamine-hydrolysing phospholipase D